MAEDAFNSFDFDLPSAPHQTQFPYPTYEEHEAAGRRTRASISSRHILWLPDGPLESATLVLSLHEQEGIIQQEPLWDRDTNK